MAQQVTSLRAEMSDEKIREFFEGKIEKNILELFSEFIRIIYKEGSLSIEEMTILFQLFSHEINLPASIDKAKITSLRKLVRNIEGGVKILKLGQILFQSKFGGVKFMTLMLSTTHLPLVRRKLLTKYLCLVLDAIN